MTRVSDEDLNEFGLTVGEFLDKDSIDKFDAIRAELLALRRESDAARARREFLAGVIEELLEAGL